MTLTRDRLEGGLFSHPVRSKKKTLLFLALSQVLALGILVAVLELFMMGYRGHLRRRLPTGPSAVGPGSPAKTASGSEEKRTYFIISAGDSHTYGKGAPEGRGYPAQLIEMIRASGRAPDARVENLGLPGLNSSQIRERFLSFLFGSIRPDLAIICAGNNNKQNLTFTGFLEEEIAGLPPRGRIAHLLENSGAYRLSVIARSRMEQILAGGDDSRTPWSGCVFCEGDEPFLMRWLEHDLEIMVLAAKARGLNVILMNYFWGQDYVDETMKKVAEKYDAAFLDVLDFQLPFFRSRDPLIAPDWHPNEKGYARIAELLFKRIQKENWLPAPATETTAGQDQKAPGAD